jgi:hypothetical protein
MGVLEGTLMRATTLWIWWLVVLLSALAGTAAAQPAGKPSPVPPELEPWIPWVLAQEPQRECRKIADAAQCSWPGRLELEVNDRGGRFSLEVVLDAESDVTLPGSDEIWPQAVRVDGKDAVVLPSAPGPSVRLAAGSRQLTGEFRWPSLPEGLPIAAATGVVLLSVNGEDIGVPKRDAGRVWLKRAASEEGDGEALNLEVFRRIDDGVPLTITTRLLLRVSGRARELGLGNVLLAGTTPLSLSSELPVRLDPEQGLFVQLRPGTYKVEIASRSNGSLDALAPLARPAPWPEREIWVFKPNPALREVELSGAPATDPGRTNLDEDWRSLATYTLGKGDTLKLKTTRRGEASPPPNRLDLVRSLWLDLDGGGWTARDQFSGDVHQTWRLDLERGTLGRAEVSGRDELVTLDPKTKRAGVEVREAKLALIAESRLPAGRGLLAVGWSEDAQSLRAALHLPPGYRLLGAKGVDSVSGAWLDSWDLFDFFFVLVVALALWRLGGPGWGALLLVALAITHGEDGAPRWVFACLLVLWALLALVPQGRFRLALRGVWWGAALTFAVLALTFGVAQVRRALYPQLGESSGEVAIFQETLVAEKAAPAGSVAEPEEEYSRGSSLLGAKQKKAELRSDVAQQQQMTQDPKAVIQTGPGIPTWTWTTSMLSWSGPVDRNHEVELYWLTPRQSSVLGFLRALLVVGLGYIFFRGTPRGAEPPPRKRSSVRPAVAAAAATLAALALLWPARAQAEIPSAETLESLKQHLLPAPACGTACVSVSAAELQVTGNRLRIELEVHAGAPSSMPLPGPAASWVFERFETDGKPSAGVALLGDGHLHARLEPGKHTLVLEGPINGDELTLAFGLNPRSVSVRAERWDVEGLRENGRIDGSLRLLRRLEQNETPAQSTVALPPWFEIERRLELGVTWKIVSTLRRISPPGTPAVVRFPLLPGERVQGDRPLEGGQLILALGRDDTTATWESTLDARDVIELRAPDKAPWSEVWVLACSVVFRCTPTGIPPVQQLAEGRWQPTFRPWPKEELRVAVSRPQAAAGSSTTIDSVSYALTPGVRLLRAVVTLRVRSTTGGVQIIELPEGAKLQTLKVDGSERATRQDGRALAVALGTGAQTIEAEWQQPIGLETLFRAPRVDLKRPSVNTRLSIQMPEERWLLFAGGPSWGPAILFWGYLIVVLAAALVLGRLGHSPLQTLQWALLGLGLTQVPAAVAIGIAAWFFLMDWRGRWQPKRALPFDLFQLFMAFATLVFVGMLVSSVYKGLVVQPDMQVEGGGSHGGALHWYVDRITSALPEPWIVSVPLWVFRALMLAWALWLALSLVRWLRWGFVNFTTGGAWRPLTLTMQPPAYAQAGGPPAPVVPVEPSPSVEPEQQPPQT